MGDSTAAANVGGDVGGDGTGAEPTASAPASSATPGSSAARPTLPVPLGAGECVSTGTIAASLRPAKLLFLIDRSASLQCNLPPLTGSASCEAEPQRLDATQPSKWEVMQQALEATFERLPESASAAITYFNNDDRCGVQSAPHVAMERLDDAQRAALTESLDAVEPRGGTPIVGGLVLAYKQLNPDQTPDQPPGNRFVVLITDGEEGCDPDQVDRLLGEELPKSRTARITTFVVGVPGSEVNRGLLSRLAYAGGAPRSDDCEHDSADPSVGDCHFDMTRQGELAAQLREALGRITDRALGCEFDVPAAPGAAGLDYGRVNVVYTDAAGDERLVGQDAARPCEGGANGWQYNDDRSRVLLCGDACARVRNAASIRIALGCESIRVD